MNRCAVEERRVEQLDRGLALCYKVGVNTAKRSLAILLIFLVFPAGLFMTSLFVQNIQPRQYEPAHTASLLVEWFSARPRLGLDVCLIALPLAAFAIGCATILRNWQSDVELRRVSLEALNAIKSHLATVLIAGATLTAGGILAIVALHMITD